MVNIPNAGKLVPLMFQAQVKGRSQLQYIDQNAEVKDSQRWASEWTQEAYPHLPELGNTVSARTYKMQWRFDSYDLAPYLQAGNNTLAALVWNGTTVALKSGQQTMKQ